MPQKDPQIFDLKLIELDTSLNQAVISYSPSEVRDIVCNLFAGHNYRSLTEKPTRQAISVFAAWLLNLTHRAYLFWRETWKEELFELVSRKGSSQYEKWVKLWLLGLTQKTTVNLGIKSDTQREYQKMVKDATEEVITKLNWQPTQIILSTEQLEMISLSPGDSIWLLQIAGAAVLTIRGSKKATIGKRLEKAIARAALNVLGLTEGQHFWLNIGRDQEVDREIDAEIATKRGHIRVDIALIGTGNQEVSEDKLSRVDRHGIVLVDILGAKSQVLKNAARHEVKVIQLRNNYALKDLYDYLSPLMPPEITLIKPPADELKLNDLLHKLPDTVFALPK